MKTKWIQYRIGDVKWIQNGYNMDTEQKNMGTKSEKNYIKRICNGYKMILRKYKYSLSETIQFKMK